MINLFVGDDGSSATVAAPSNTSTDFFAIQSTNNGIHHLFGTDGSYVNSGSIYTPSLSAGSGSINGTLNVNGTVSCANATATNQAVALGQLENASLNPTFYSLTCEQNVTALPSTYDTNKVSIIEATTATAGVTFASSDPRILDVGIGPLGPFVRAGANNLDLTPSNQVLVPNANQSNASVNLGQLQNQTVALSPTTVNASGTVSANGIISNNSIQANGQFLAAEGTGPTGGYTFTLDGSHDTGMFSPSDGVLNFYNNSVNTFSSTPTSFTVNVPATFNGQIQLQDGQYLQFGGT
jgi:hypothetical protein